jgi:AraC-like DNA-binding protein
MTIYTTPLQFGYFFSLLLWVLLLVRGIREQRLSDRMLGWVMLLLALAMQDYTFGFAGINLLWEELNGFPRNTNLLFGPIVYFYFRSQVNRSFKFKLKHGWHLLPYALYFCYNLSIFVQGSKTVQESQSAVSGQVIDYAYHVVVLASYWYYFGHCLRIYRAYRAWSLDQHSDIELIGFRWFRNFVYAMIFWISFRVVMLLLDEVLDLSFYQDWWWNLALVTVAVYIGLTGWAQRQPANIHFETSPSTEEPAQQPEGIRQEETLTPEKIALGQKLAEVMRTERLYLQPELTLHDLAKRLNTNASILSATINQVFQQNFNDYINTLRIEAFISAYQLPENRPYTMLFVALDAGFNSKATFNRAFKKAKGCAPKDYFGTQPSAA